MNTPSPLVPQGSFQDKGKSHVRITVFAILAIHVVLLGVLLIAGCNKKPEVENAETTVANQPPPAAATDWPPSTPAAPGDTAVPPIPQPVPTPLTEVPAPGGTVTPPPIPAPAPAIVEQAPPPPVIEPPAGSLTEHTILKGETLATIGKKYGVGYKAIEAANPGLNPTRLKIGDKIKIPARTTAATTASSTSTTTSDGTRVYVVKSGDNLLKISKTTGVPVKELRSANNLRTDQIRVGQKLKIPVRAPAPPPAEAVAPPPVAPPTTVGNP